MRFAGASGDMGAMTLHGAMALRQYLTMSCHGMPGVLPRFRWRSCPIVACRLNDERNFNPDSSNDLVVETAEKTLGSASKNSSDIPLIDDYLNAIEN